MPSLSVCEGKTSIGTTPSTAKATLALTQEESSFGFHMIQDGFVKTLLGY